MNKQTKRTGLAVSIPKGLGISTALSLLITVVSSAILAGLVTRETIQEAQIGYYTMGILSLSAFAGAVLAAHRIKHRRIFVCTVSAIVYWLLLLATTALFFGGQYAAVGETLLMILIGAAAAATLGIRKDPVRRRHRIKVH